MQIIVMADPLDWEWNVSDDVMYPRMTYMAPASDNLKAQSHISSRTSSAQKNEEFWSVRCDSLGVRQNLLMI